MSEKPISDLRRRMLQDMAVRKFGEKTRHDYIRHVEAFAKFLGRSPDTATAEDVRRFQVHLTESGVQPPTLNSSASALRFFFGITLDRAELARHLARVHYPRKLPRVLSPEEVGRLLEAAPGPGLKYKAALSIAYGAGLRAGEVMMLRVSDIDSKRMLICVEQGNRRLIAADANSVTFKVKDYRIEGPGRYTTMTLSPGEFIRRFLQHVLPKGFHRIRHYGLLAGTAKADMLATARQLLCVPATELEADEDVATQHVQKCPCCGGRMHVIETFAAGRSPQPQLIGAGGRHQDRYLMSTIALSNIIALLSCWSATGCDDARAMQRPTPHSPPQSCLSPTAIGAAIDPNALTANRDRQRAGPDPITVTRADALKSP